MRRILILLALWSFCTVPAQPVHADGGARTMLNLINQARARGATCGGRWYRPAPRLRLRGRLSRAAARWAQHMLRTGTFSHSIGGSTFVRRIWAVCGRTEVGENLSGNRSAADAVRRLLRSPGHCRNIMNPRYRYVGIGTAKGGRYGAYWVQKFASRC